MIIRGTPSNSRYAKNYIGTQADNRLQEVVPSIQQQGLNALNVDWVPVQYYQLVPSNITCTCREVQVVQQHSQASTKLDPVLTKVGGIHEIEVEIDWKQPLFGTRNENPTPEMNAEENDLLLVDDDETDNEDAVGTTAHVFSSVADCGICYRSGMVPGYKAYGYQRVLCSTQQIDAVKGYTIVPHTAPNTMERCDDHGWVEFLVAIPKYFKNAKCSVWNNKVQLSEKFTLQNGQPLSQLVLNQMAGKKLPVRITAAVFTHAVIEFDLNVAPLHANFAQMTKATDWTMLDTLGQLSVVMPMTINQVTAGDVLYVPSRKQGFKVTDVTYLQTARNIKLDWQFQVRVLQPQETMLNLVKGTVVF